jgi:hypothetical protein
MTSILPLALHGVYLRYTDNPASEGQLKDRRDAPAIADLRRLTPARA